MKLPEELNNVIETLASSQDFKALKTARAVLSEDYAQGFSSQTGFKDNSQLLSYIITRMPATFGACTKVFQEIQSRLPDFRPTRILDLGAGPGTATWAALDTFSTLTHLHLIEREQTAIEIGKKIASFSNLPQWTKAEWVRSSLQDPFPIPLTDIAVLSYVFAEMDDFSILDRLQEIPLIVIIEPGTPKGFERIRAIRDQALQKGMHLIAPCPHAFKCPMKENDWCHFYARVERTRLHRQLKEGSLGFEDEKFSYLVLAKDLLIAPFKGRVLRHPQKGSGHVKLSLCASNGQVEQLTVSKKEKQVYRNARDADWGTAWM